MTASADRRAEPSGAPSSSYRAIFRPRGRSLSRRLPAIGYALVISNQTLLPVSSNTDVSHQNVVVNRPEVQVRWVRRRSETSTAVAARRHPMGPQ